MIDCRIDRRLFEVQSRRTAASLRRSKKETNHPPQSLIVTCHPERSRTFCEARNEPIKKREPASGIYKHVFVDPLYGSYLPKSNQTGTRRVRLRTTDGRPYGVCEKFYLHGSRYGPSRTPVPTVFKKIPTYIRSRILVEPPMFALCSCRDRRPRRSVKRTPTTQQTAPHTGTTYLPP